MSVLQSIFGFAVLGAIAWACCQDRRRIPWKTVIAGAGLQIALAAVLLKVPLFRQLFLALNDVLLSLERATRAGTSFVFGYLGGGSLPFEESYAGASFVLAFRALPLVLVISALSALLFYWRVLPVVVKAISRLLQRTLGIGGAVGIGAAANIFVGMVEAPLFVRPYLKHLSRGELFMIMTSGMATISGTVMVLYASIVASVTPDAMGHLLTASIINVPASIAVAALMVPPDREFTSGELVDPDLAVSTMDAITKGTLQGVQLLLNIVAMLIVLVALVSLANQLLGVLPLVGEKPITLQRLLGYVMAPIVWLMGIPWSELPTAGALMGTKIILNELIAYSELAALPDNSLSPRSQLIMIYGMCGFANLGSLGIMIGGLGTMVPEHRGEVTALGLRSIVAGTLATCMTGAVIGMLSG